MNEKPITGNYYREKQTNKQTNLQIISRRLFSFLPVNETKCFVKHKYLNVS